MMIRRTSSSTKPKQSIEEVFKRRSPACMHLLGEIGQTVTRVDAEFRAQFKQIVDKLQDLSTSGLKSQQDIAVLRTEPLPVNPHQPLDNLQKETNCGHQERRRDYAVLQNFMRDQVQQMSQQLESTQMHLLGQIASINQEVQKAETNIGDLRSAKGNQDFSLLSHGPRELDKLRYIESTLTQLQSLVRSQQRDINTMKGQMAFLHSRLAAGGSEAPAPTTLDEGMNAQLSTCGRPNSCLVCQVYHLL